MIEFGVLGPVGGTRDGVPLALGGRKQRAVLAILLLNAGRVVPLHQIVAGVWGERASATATNTAQVYVSALRRALAPDRDLIVTQDPGYRLDLGEHRLDLATFLGAATEGRQLLDDGRYGEAAHRLRDGLAAWRGPALADCGDEPFAAAEATALEESRLAVLEARIDAELAVGRAGELVGELRVLVAGHPLRERFHALLMEALYRCGRRADALAVYRAARVVLRDELGADPGPELRALERTVLAEGQLSRAHRSARPYLLVQDGGGHQQVVALDAGRSPFTIGRRSSNDLSLGWDSQVSRVHARLEREDRGWVLVDDGSSRNGSFVNGERVVGRRPLQDGEVVRLGRTVLLYRATGSVPPGPRRDSGVTAEAAVPRVDAVGPQERAVLSAVARAVEGDRAGSLVAEVARVTGRPAAAVAEVLDALRQLFAVTDLPAQERDAVLVSRARAIGVPLA